MHGIGVFDQTTSQMSTHDQAHNASLQLAECSQNAACCSQPSSCQCRVEASRGRILRELQNASEADLSESRPQPPQQGSPSIYESSRRFIPRGCLLRILDTRRVAEHLETLLNDLQRSNQLADYISPGSERVCHCEDGLCTGSRVILASLMRIGKEDCIIHLYNQSKTRVCDADLPFSDQGEVLKSFGGLTEKEAQLFRHAQWPLRSHYLSRLEPNGHNYQQLDDEVALPFLRIDERTRPVSGERTIVRHIKIYPNHHNLGDGDDFALKTFKKLRYSSEDFHEEFEANQQAPQHDRIVPVLTAFKHREEFHFIFPYANGGNLEELWKKYSTSNAAGSLLASWYSPQWLLSECLGLAEGLAATHRPSAIAELGTQYHLAPQLHADLKARNILCFEAIEGGRQSYTLKLADFGFARKVDENSTLKVGDMTHTQTYRPPEYDIEDVIHLNYDVWCLGCVYVEFITWAVMGWPEVDKFAGKRIEERDDEYTSTAKGEILQDTFFKKVARLPRWYDLSGVRLKVGKNTEITSKKTAANEHWLRISRGNIRISCSVKDSVTKHINDLKNNETCAPEFRRFLDFIKTKMLVIDASARANSNEVEMFLRGMTNGQLN
ncbi:kinase-like protein [Xylaria sp. FL0064]|nr:kinase-like protein [Xylaria sp. FL0064]